jgi:hypothetical protein
VASSNTTTSLEAPVVATLGGMTFTSPTLYVSYRQLSAVNPCNATVGSPIFDAIIAIPTESELSSTFASPSGSADVGGPAVGITTGTASFNISDLDTVPVPMSIYKSQPWCASWWITNAGNPWNVTATSLAWSCPQSEPYKSILHVPPNLVQALRPDWADCYQAWQGVYDPPKPLTPVNVEASVTIMPGTGETTSPTAPSSSVPAFPTTSSTTQASESDASPTSDPITSTSTETKSVASTSVSGAVDPAHTLAVGSSGDPPAASAENTRTTNAVPVLKSALSDVSASEVTIPNSNTSSAQDPEKAGGSQTQQVKQIQRAQETQITRQTRAQLPHQKTPVELTVGSQTFTAAGVPNVFTNAETAFTLMPGSSTMSIAGQAVSVASSGMLVVGSGADATTIRVQPQAVEPNPTSVQDVSSVELTLGSQIFTAAGTNNVFANSETAFTLGPESSIITVAGQAIRVASSGVLIVGSGTVATTITLPSETVAALQGSGDTDPTVTFNIGDTHTPHPRFKANQEHTSSTA